NPVRSALEARLTHPRFIESHRLSPYPNRSTEIGVVLDLMIHDLEIILHLVRSPVKHMDAVGVPVLSRGEDIANARIRFENGCVANVTVSRISPEKMRKIRVFQEDAYLSLDYQNQTGEIYRKSGWQITREAVEIEPGEPLKRELQAFVECAQAGAKPLVSGYEATAALALALEITQQIEIHNARREIAALRPDAVVLIDYPGFNLRLASALKKSADSPRIIYYISPQVWAWNRRRIPKMARVVDLMICIFPFEKPLYEKSGLKT